MGMFWTIAFPVFFVLIFGMVFSGTGDVHYSIECFWRTAVKFSSDRRSFRQVDVLTVQEGDRETEMSELKAGHLNAVVVIPSTMMASMASGQTTNLEVYYDPAQTSSSQIVLSILDKVVQHIDREMTKRPVMLAGSNSIQNQQMMQLDYILPVFWRWR